MSDVYQLVAPVVRAEGSELTPVSVQLAFNQLALSIKTILNTIAQGNPPNGPAGGDLSGNYPNPTVSSVHATSGTIDGTIIGGVTPAAGTFSTLTLSAALAIAQGGTGATTQAGALSNILGASAVPIANGGTAATTQAAALSNILGASAVPIANGGTAATTASGARTNLGLGTIATQNANAVAITGGTIEGTIIGGVTPASGAFTTLTASTPVGVASGGSGANTHTIHGVLIGEAAAAVNTTAAGTTGQMLLGVTGADPAFGNNPTITGGTVNGAVIGGSTPAAGSFTTITASSTITPSSTAGIVGTILVNNANAGSIGEYLTNTTTGTSVTSGVPANATSVSLTAGDWDVSGVVLVTPAGSTVIQAVILGVTTTSATRGAFGSEVVFQLTVSAGQGEVISSPVVRINIASTTTVFAIAQCNFTVSTCTVDGFIRARRVR